MTVCAKCGFENNANVKNCVNCLVDLHWAKVNLGKFHGTTDDTRRIGIASRRERGYSIPDDEITPLEPILIEQDIAKNSVKWSVIGLIVGIFTGLFFTGLSFINTNSLYGPFLSIIFLSPAGILFGIIGAFLGNRSKTTALIVAFLAALLGVGFLYFLFNFTCLFCI